MITIIAILGLLIKSYQDYKRYGEQYPLVWYFDKNDFLMLSIVAFCDLLTIGITWAVISL